MALYHLEIVGDVFETLNMLRYLKKDRSESDEVLLLSAQFFYEANLVAASNP